MPKKLKKAIGLDPRR